MKTKKLIEELMKADPSGELECCVGNLDIWYVDTLPAYYDGTLQVLQRDEKGYVCGGKYKRSGQKVDIHYISFADLVYDRQNFDIDYSELSQEAREKTQKHHQEIRDSSNKLDIQLEWQYFKDWARKKAEELTVDIEPIENIAFEFFEKNVSPKDDYAVMIGENYITTRAKQWSEKFEVIIDDGFLEIREKNAP